MDLFKCVLLPRREVKSGIIDIDCFVLSFFVIKVCGWHFASIECLPKTRYLSKNYQINSN